MASSYKEWDKHSDRWKREHTKAGETRARWNRFLKLSDKTRKTLDIRKYAAGVSAPVQRRNNAVAAVVRKVSSASAGRATVIAHNTSLMSAKELQWTLKATQAQIRARAADKKYIVNGRNPWWYKSV